MKNKKRKIAVIALVVCLIAILSMGSLAWFSASDEVTNNLTFSTDFEMDLYETDEEGKQKTDVNGKTVGMDYTDLTPGQSIHKDPTVINKSTSASQYIRMSVTVDNYAKWAAIIPAGKDLTSIFTGFDAVSWKRYDEPTIDNTADTITYVFYLEVELAAGQTANLFTGVTIPDYVTLDQAKNIGTFHITIKADAIQTENMGTSVKNAHDAFAKAGM